MAMEVSEKHQKLVPEFKKNVEKAYQHFRSNYNRFNQFRKFFFKSSLTDEDIALLKALQKPQIEVNLGEAYISRLMGEFSKQEPSIEVRSGHDTPVPAETIELVDGYFRHLLCDSNKKNFEYRIMDDLYSGGWSVAKVRTDYVNKMSFHQDFFLDRVYEPTLCGFDPMAREPSKADGEFCFENFPMTKEQFKSKYKHISIDNVSFIADQSGFSWSYRSEDNDCLIVCDYYKKKRKRFTIVQLADNSVMPKSEYDEMIKAWQESGRTEQPPIIVNERKTEEITVIRYRFIENQMIEVDHTDFPEFPLVFIDGNSKLIRESEGGNFEFVTRPYLYHCKDLQRLMNFSVQTLANYLENMIMHKFKIAKEAIPQEEDYLQAYNNVQQATQLVYNAYKDDNPDMQLPAPQEIVNVAAPPEVMGTVQMATGMMQNILGSFDASLGINDNQLAGVAIVEGATQSNAAAMPYIVGFLQGLSHIANIIVKMLPKYWTMPRTVPIRSPKGETQHAPINQPGSPKIDYDQNSLHVIVKAGLNFNVQQTKALKTVIELSQANKAMGDFFAVKGLPFILDNIDIKGIEQLKKMAEEWQQEMMQQQKAAANQPNPAMLTAQNNQMKLQLEAKKLQLQEHEAMLKAKTHEDQLRQDQQDNQIELLKLHSENTRHHKEHVTEHVNSHLDRLIAAHDMTHRHSKEALETVHKMNLEEKRHDADQIKKQEGSKKEH